METKEEGGGLKRVTFARTPVMSTYLLAFVVGEFDHVEERDANGLLIRVFTPVGKGDKGLFALSVRGVVLSTGIPLGRERETRKGRGRGERRGKRKGRERGEEREREENGECQGIGERGKERGGRGMRKERVCF